MAAVFGEMTWLIRLKSRVIDPLRAEGEWILFLLFWCGNRLKIRYSPELIAHFDGLRAVSVFTAL